MKTLLVSLLTLSFSAFGNTNLSDSIDQNEVPAENEERQEETINRPDVLDKNKTPSVLEEREQKEEWRDDYSQEQYDTKKRQNKQK